MCVFLDSCLLAENRISNLSHIFKIVAVWVFKLPMLLRKLRISVSLKMITSVCNLVLFPFSDKNSTFLHSPPFLTVSRIQFLHNSIPTSNSPKQFVFKSAAQQPITQSTEGIPRLAKADAQVALFEYLHSTRGLSFLDSEHISKNSPQFLKGLMAKIDPEKDVLRALSRFFRYNPINEFEPFFESMGLSEREFAPFLPRGLIFLSDDQLLLDNYHILSDYGLPRSEIGRLYKEVNEIFRYECGVLGMKLRAYEQLGLNRSTVIKLVSCSPQLLAGEVDKAFLGVLERMKELGFDSNWIGGHLSSKNTYNWNRWNRIIDTLCFVRELGFSYAQMDALFREDAALLFAGCGKQVYVVVGSLLKLGLKVKEVLALVLENRQILSPKCAKNFSKALHFLVEVGMKPENIVQILSSHMELLASHSLKGLKTVLKDFNGDKHSLCQAIEKDPSAFFNLAFKMNKCGAAARNPNNIVEKKDFLMRLGYVENSVEMVKALKRFRGRGDQLQERFDCLVCAGLDFNTVSSMVKQAPTVLNQTRNILERKIDCLKNYLGYPVESIAGFPSYLCYDMKRISLRFSMYAWLRERGSVKPMLSVSTLLACSDARFVKCYVGIHPKGPAMWEKLKKSLASD